MTDVQTFLAQLSEQCGPQLAQAAIFARRVEGIHNLILIGFLLACALTMALLGRRYTLANRPRFPLVEAELLRRAELQGMPQGTLNQQSMAELEMLERRSTTPEQVGAQLIGAGFQIGGTVLALVVFAFGVLNPWNWLAAFNPLAAYAHDLVGKVLR